MTNSGLLSPRKPIYGYSKQVAQRATIAHLRASKSSNISNSSKVSRQTRKNVDRILPIITRLFVDFFRHSRTAKSAVSRGIRLKFELIQLQAFMVILVICKNVEYPIKKVGASVLTTFLPLLVYGNFSDAQCQFNVHGQIRPNFVLIRDFMFVLLTCRNEEYRIKNEGAKVLTRCSQL